MFKEIGTLSEIGAKVGDVVELAGREFKVLDVCDRTGYLLCRADIPDEGGRFPLTSSYQFRIISCAEQSPVRTVMRKEIVPGVYGKVIVGEELLGDVTIGFSETVCGRALLNRADLIAARDVFNQLIDALED